MRIFCDRLVGDADREFVSGKIAEVMQATFPDESGAAMADASLPSARSWARAAA